MPNIATPATLAYTGGMLRTARMVPARLRYTAGNVLSARDTPLSTLAEIPRLDRLTRFDKLVREGGVDPRFQLIWQQTVEAIESAFEAVNARVDEVAILARLSAVESLAEVANDNAVSAQASVAVVSTAVADTFTDIDPTLGTGFNDRLEE